MNDQPDFAALAREYLDLWEDQLTAMAADPDLARQSARFFDMLNTVGAQANPLVAANLAAMLRTPTGHRDEPLDATPAEDGAAAAAAAPDDRDERLDQLARRVADLEKRIAGLEAERGGTRKKSSKGTRRKPAAKRS